MRPPSPLSPREAGLFVQYAFGSIKSRRLARMLDSLVRVSRRVGWAAHLLTSRTRDGGPVEADPGPTTPPGPRRASPSADTRRTFARVADARRRTSRGPTPRAPPPSGRPGLRGTRPPRGAAGTDPRAVDRRPAGRDALLGENCARSRHRPPRAAPPPSATRAARRRAPRTAPGPHRTESPRSALRAPPVYPRTVSRTLELSLQSSFQLSLTVLVCYRSRGCI